LETAAQHKTVNRAATLQPAASAKVVQRRTAPATRPLRVVTATKVSSPHDPAEKEAEATAKKIMRMAAPEGSSAAVESGSGGVLRQVSREAPEKKPQTPMQSPYIRRFVGSGGFAGKQNREEEKLPRKAEGLPQKEAPIQRKVEGQPNVAANVAAEVQNSVAAGSPLPLNVRRFMEPRFRADFSKVRVHTGDKAAKLSRQLNAQAFAIGNQIFFGKERFQPESLEGKELIAHELTHTIQQGGAVQRSEEVRVTQQSPTMVQRLGFSAVLDHFANAANLIPGFRMFTIILGVNPINMSRVERSAANILRALVEFIPGGGLITKALDNYGIFDQAGTWVEQQIRTLGMTGSAIKQALKAFLDGRKWTDLFDLGGVWEQAKQIFTGPIERIISFAKGLLSGFISLIKDAILRPLAKLAEGTSGYDLLKAVLGQDPVTGDPVPRTADTLIGGFMKLIGQQEVWNNLKKANAVARAWAWFQSALAALMGFVRQIPKLFMNALKSLELEDIILVPRAFGKLVGVFGDFVGSFMRWAGNAVWNLLEIIFDVVSPGALGYIKKTGAALKSILKNPLPFVGNLVKAAKLGFQNFAANFGAHLKAGLIDWLTGSLPGVYIPKAFSLGEIVKFVFSVLGISWQNLRQKLVKVVGEPAVKAMETGFDIVVTLVTQGPAAAWDKIKDQLANLKDMVIGGITDFVVSMVVQKAVPKIVAMFIPGAGFISAILTIYDTVMVFVNKLAKIAQVVTGFISSIAAIAAGAIGAAASRVETTLAGLLSLAINFLAGFAGLGKVADKVMGVINKVRAPIDKALDALIAWIVTMAKKLFAKVFGKKDKDGKPDERTTEQKQVDLDEAVKETNAIFAEEGRRSKAERMLVQIKQRYRLTKAQIAVDERKHGTTFFHADLEINPVAKSNKAGEMDYIDPPIRVVPAFFCKKSLAEAEFKRQLDLQEATINAMDVHTWLANRSRFERAGRSPEGTKLQRQTLDDAYDAFRAKVIAERSKLYRSSQYGLTPPQAIAKAEGFANRLLAYTTAANGRRRFKNSQLTDSAFDGKVIENELYKKAALHALDQVAGGSGTDIAGLGGAREDFSLGAQWKGTRIETLEKKVKQEIKGKKAEEQKNIRMSVKLPATYE